MLKTHGCIINCLSRGWAGSKARTCISQTLPALPTTLLILMPIVPIPVAIAAAVEVAVLLAALVAVDESVDDRDESVALVEVASVVAVEPIVMPDIPDIVPMSMPDISMFSLLLDFRFEWKGNLMGLRRLVLQFAVQHDGRD